jgi:WD40 repeat protein
VNDIGCLAFSPDGKRLASGSADWTVRVWDAAGGAALLTLCGHEGVVASVAFSPDGKRIASGARDWTVRVWDAVSGAPLACLRGHKRRVSCLAFSPDGTLLASGSRDRTVRVWDVARGAELACLRGHDADVGSITFCPDGSHLRVISSDRVVSGWRLPDRIRVAAVEGPRAAGEDDLVGPLAEQVDDLLLGQLHGVLGRLAEAGLHPGRSPRAVEVLPEVREHGLNDGEISCGIAFSPDGKRAFSLTANQTVKVWDVTSRTCLEEIPGPTADRPSPGQGPAESFEVVNDGFEAVIKSREGQPVAWFPESLFQVTTHPADCILAGAFGHHVYLIRLEGDLSSLQ